MKPLADRVLIKPDVADEKIGGLYMQPKERDKPQLGTVLAVGPGLANQKFEFNFTGTSDPEAVNKLIELVKLVQQPVPTGLKPGDRVMFGKYSGTKVRHRGEEVLYVRVSDVLSILEEGDEKGK